MDGINHEAFVMVLDYIYGGAINLEKRQELLYDLIEVAFFFRSTWFKCLRYVVLTMFPFLTYITVLIIKSRLLNFHSKVASELKISPLVSYCETSLGIDPKVSSHKHDAKIGLMNATLTLPSP